MAEDHKDQRPWLADLLLGLLLVLAVLCLIAWFLQGRWSAGPSLESATRNDIRQLSYALEAFRARFGKLPPSRIRLCSNLKDYDQGDLLDRDSLAFLSNTFPRMTSRFGDIPSDRQHNWGGGLGRLPTILQGDQCLVFFLGGVPAKMDGQIECTGFAVNPQEPTQAGGDRMGPFFEFDPQRLWQDPGNGFLSYLDRYGKQPYAYFSSYRKPDGYNVYFLRFHDSDCSRLGVWPYAESLGESPRYYNPNTFQILSARADGKFGLGTRLPDGRTWTPAGAERIDAAGSDDLSNFYESRLGRPE